MTDESNRPFLYVVITDFNGWAQTETCLRRLQASSFRDFKVVVVDHGTTDETAQGLANYPSCLRVRADSDLWWTGATNVGIRAALESGASQVMLLNNDCYVDESTLANIAEHAKNLTPGVVAPLQRSAESGELLTVRTGTCFTLGFPTFVLPHMKRLPASADALLSTKMIVGGRGVVIPAEVFDIVGLFDESELPHYGADHDFYMRCRASGIPLLIATDASVEIDDTRTTVATNLGAMNWGQFRESLRSPRSHRNVSTLTTLFSRYYPVQFLFFIGVALNLARYFVGYLFARLASLLGR